MYLTRRLGAITPGQSGPGNNSNKRILCNLQSSSITGASPQIVLCLIQHTRWWGPYPSAEMQSVHTTAKADCAFFVLWHLNHRGLLNAKIILVLGTVEYADSTPAEVSPSLIQTNVLDIKLNHLMARLQPWSFVEFIMTPRTTLNQSSRIPQSI